MNATTPSRHLVRHTVSIVVLGHALLHLLGPLTAAGVVTFVSQVPHVAETILWFGAALATATAAVALWFEVHWYWMPALIAALVSQSAIAMNWNEAAFGSVINLLLIGCAVYGFASLGPVSFSARFRRAEQALCSTAGTGRTLRDADLSHLPSAVATYIRRSGAVGKAVPRGFSAALVGRIRSSATGAWMSFTARQINCYDSTPSRYFHLDARQRGIPADVLHELVNGKASMRIRIASLVPTANAHGAQMDRAETVTLFNDLCLFTPALLATSSLSFEELDANTVQVTYINGTNTISAVLIFDAAGDLRNFISNDRFRASADGKSFEQESWSTPVTSYRHVGGSRMIGQGRAVWSAQADPEPFDYIELSVTDYTSR